MPAYGNGACPQWTEKLSVDDGRPLARLFEIRLTAVVQVAVFCSVTLRGVLWGLPRFILMATCCGDNPALLVVGFYPHGNVRDLK